MGPNAMSTLERIGQEKEKISQRLMRLDTQRDKLAAQLNELEAAERVLSRFEKPRRGEGPLSGRAARARSASKKPRRRARAAAKQAKGPSVSDAVLKAVQGHPDGISAKDVLKQLSSEPGLSVRPNHLGIALQRHRRAGRLEQRGLLWLPSKSASQAAA